MMRTRTPSQIDMLLGADFYPSFICYKSKVKHTVGFLTWIAICAGLLHVSLPTYIVASYIQSIDRRFTTSFLVYWRTRRTQNSDHRKWTVVYQVYVTKWDGRYYIALPFQHRVFQMATVLRYRRQCLKLVHHYVTSENLDLQL